MERNNINIMELIHFIKRLSDDYSDENGINAMHRAEQDCQQTAVHNTNMSYNNTYTHTHTHTHCQTDIHTHDSLHYGYTAHHKAIVADTDRLQLYTHTACTDSAT